MNFEAINDDVTRTLAGHVRRHPDEVQDAVQAAWLAWLLHGGHVADPGGGWLYVVAWREWVHQTRRAGRVQPVPADEFERAAPDFDLDGWIDFRDTLACLRPVRRAGVMARLLGLSYEQTQEATGRTYTWVNRQLVRGRSEMREAMA